MKRPSKTTTQEAASTASRPSGQFGGFDPAGGFSQAWETYLSSCAALHAETLRFWGDRVADDAETLRAVAACRSPQELAQLQWEWLMRMSRSYTDESSRAMELAAELAWPERPERR